MSSARRTSQQRRSMRPFPPANPLLERESVLVRKVGVNARPGQLPAPWTRGSLSARISHPAQPHFRCRAATATGAGLSEGAPAPAGEFAYAAVLRFLETKERLCVSHVVRFHVQICDDTWVAADWNGGRFNVNRWFGDADEGVGSASARTS